jgi:hypothetical protein
MLKWLKRIKCLFNPPEYTQFLGGFNFLFSRQIEYIIDVINEELKKSRGFGLILTPEDELKEKIVILTIFNKWGQTLNKRGPSFAAKEYEQVIRDIQEGTRTLLKKELRKYFEATPPGETKTRYNCHLESVATRLARDFMDRKCVFWME